MRKIGQQGRTLPPLQSHPHLGASWEGFALEQVSGLLARLGLLGEGRGGTEANTMSLKR
jgi:hypothetical protein